MSDEPELKPCPFCGTSLDDKVHPSSTVESGDKITLECGKCGANWPPIGRDGDVDLTSNDAIAAFWNTRAGGRP